MLGSAIAASTGLPAERYLMRYLMRHLMRHLMPLLDCRYRDVLQRVLVRFNHLAPALVNRRRCQNQ
jgi:hypothetical protein